MADTQSNPKPEPGSQSQDHEPKPREPVPIPIRTGPDWAMIVGAGFGGITLIAMLVFAFLAGTGHKNLICDSFQLLAVIVAFGAGLSAAFMGGRAAAQGQLGSVGQQFSVTYGLGGGVAFFAIAFLLFSSFPPRCEPPAERRSELKFLNVPGSIKLRSHDRYWRKENPEWENGAVKWRATALRAEDERSFGPVEILDNEDRSICAVKVHMVRDQAHLGADQRAYVLDTIDLNDEILLYFNKDWWRRWTANPGTVKAISPDCFTLKQNDKPVHGLVAINLRNGKFYYAVAKNASPDDPAGEEVPAPKAQGTNYFSIAPAYAAAPSGLPFAELRALLNSADVEVRVHARRLLGENFERYKDDALRDLFAPSSSPDYLIGLLHGLIAGIDKATQGSKLAFAEPVRDLGIPLPYVSDRYADIVKLTGHPDDGVRKQARRLIQRFPVSAFGQYFAALEAQARERGCEQAKNDILLQGQLYASIFYNYNRIAQYLSRPSLGPQDVKAIEETSRIGFEMVECLEDDLRIDAQSLIYAKAVTYGNFNASKTLASGYAKEFVRKAQGTDYYSPSHLEVAKRFIAASDRNPAEPLNSSPVGR